ncbi:MAG: pilus assembly protein TadG-related protein [Acidobacteriota bacterium]
MPRKTDRRPARPMVRALREDGQTFVFVATILFGLIVLVSTVINVGQAVNRRVFLQMAADAGAFTGATEMARGMNTLAERNRRIQRGWATLSRVIGKWYMPCLISGRATASFGSGQAAEARIIDAVNAGYGARAVSEAGRVTHYNIGDLFPDRYAGQERVTFTEGDAALGVGPQRPRGRVVDLEEVPQGTSPKAAGGPAANRRLRYTCLVFRPGPVRVSRTASVGLWFRKKEGTPPVAFVWVVKAPATGARVFDELFGPNLIPEMTAVAAAKPVGGNIEKGEATYVTKMIPVRDLLGGVMDTWNQRWRTLTH